MLDARHRRRVRQALASLLSHHGPQGWWPVRTERARFETQTGERQTRGYHPGEFDFPRTREGRWEIVTGAVLTQNTAWSNVERALDALGAARVTAPEAMLALDPAGLGAIVRPAGYFNQKSRYLRAVAEWFMASDPALAAAPRSRATLEDVRPRLLAVRGVGPETADSVLLYAYSLPTFVIDAYTRRVLAAHGLADPTTPYEELRTACEAALDEPTAAERVRLWQESHAVIVEEAKAMRRETPAGTARRRR
ncbi:MAG: hypothetical protein JW751_25215 [Polyangiaceae bacterium]|nr:hypothetical protein [Polyangiaceae bacterium]